MDAFLKILIGFTISLTFLSMIRIDSLETDVTDLKKQITAIERAMEDR